MEAKVKEEKYQKLLTLHERVKELKQIKKSMNADYRDQIKDVESEIEDLVVELKND